MTDRDEILQEALSLPPEDRAFVAAALGDSLAQAGEKDAATAALLAELQRRSAAYRNGGTSARPASDVVSDQRQANEAEA